MTEHDTTRRYVIQVRVSLDERDRIMALAKRAGVTPSEWVRLRSLEVGITKAPATPPAATPKPERPYGSLLKDR